MRSEHAVQQGAAPDPTAARHLLAHLTSACGSGSGELGR